MVTPLKRPSLARMVVLGIALNAAACSGNGHESTEQVTSALGSSNIITRNYDNTRDGANLNETLLNTANVGHLTFGELFHLPVDDQVYAGLLYAPLVPIWGGTHNSFTSPL